MLNAAALFFCLLCLFFGFFRSPSPAGTRNPCPESYPIVGNLVGLLRNRRRFHDWVTDMLSTTPTLTLQVNTFFNASHGVCTANPLNVSHLLVANFPCYIKGSRFHDVLYDLLGDGIFNVDGQLWTLQRKISSHEFNTKSLKHFIADTVHSELSSRLIPFLSSACENDQVIDLQDILQKFGFDNICNLAFGVDPACLSSGAAGHENSIDSSFVQAFDYAAEISSSRFLMPMEAIWKIKRFFNLGSEKRLKEAIGKINDFATMIIKSKEDQIGSGNSGNLDLLSRFMSSSTSFDLGFEDEERKRKFLRDIVISFILAGRDSTSSALTWFFWLMAGNPQCKDMILAELSAIAPAPAMEMSAVAFSYEDLKGLNYLHAAISESLRLFPPIAIDSRIAVEDDTLPDGTHVRKGWFADYSAYAMGRMSEVWGPDCREYRPERGLDDDERCRPSDPFKFPVFHCGPRMCLGKMAFVQMKSVAASLMSEFEIVAVDGGGCAGKMMNPPYTQALTLKMRGGFPVRVETATTPPHLSQHSPMPLLHIATCPNRWPYYIYLCLNFEGSGAFHPIKDLQRG